jgi:HEPN domain-containing protein
MDRTELQNLTKLRVREAKLLLNNRYYDGAFYLLGYAVECAFKACVAKQMRRHDIPDRKLIVDVYTHDLGKLLSVSGLEPEYRKESLRNPAFELNWTVVKDWSEKARYATGLTKSEVEDFFSAVLSRQNGVLPWLKKSW